MYTIFGAKINRKQEDKTKYKNIFISDFFLKKTILQKVQPSTYLDLPFKKIESRH
jgi:hypothetical protein